MTPTDKLTAVIFSGILAASISACTSSSTSSPPVSSGPHTASSSAGSGSSTATAGTDQSSKVLGYRLPADVATTTSTGTAFQPAVTLHIVTLAASSDSTLLTFYLTAPTAKDVTGQFLDWANLPSLTDPASKTAYQVNTYKQKNAPTSSTGGNYHCVCSQITNAGAASDKVVYTAQYPALPSGLGTVQLTDPRFKTVTIPVSR